MRHVGNSIVCWYCRVDRCNIRLAEPRKVNELGTDLEHLQVERVFVQGISSLTVESCLFVLNHQLIDRYICDHQRL